MEKIQEYCEDYAREYGLTHSPVTDPPMGEFIVPHDFDQTPLYHAQWRRIASVVTPKYVPGILWATYDDTVDNTWAIQNPHTANLISDCPYEVHLVHHF